MQPSGLVFYVNGDPDYVGLGEKKIEYIFKNFIKNRTSLMLIPKANNHFFQTTQEK